MHGGPDRHATASDDEPDVRPGVMHDEASRAPAAPGSSAMHPGLVPLAFLLGTWRGEGVGGYPTIDDFRYGQELTFGHVGKPVLTYASRTWSLADDRPLATESGYWRPQPGGRVELVVAHGSGVVEVSLGAVTGTRVELSSDLLARTESAKDVGALHRLYGLVEADLMYAVDMAAVGQPLQPHLSARLRRSPHGELAD